MNLHYSQTGGFHRLCRMAFKYLMNLHYSQTKFNNGRRYDEFKYLMNLHYSQTSVYKVKQFVWFKYLMNLHYSQTKRIDIKTQLRLNTLWIYTILKPQINCTTINAQGNSQDIVYYKPNFQRCQSHINQNQLYITLQLPKNVPALTM